MPNADRPRGFWPVGEVGKSKSYVAGARIVPGEFVRVSADGKVDPVAAGETILGLALGFASAEDKRVLVCIDPEQLYAGQADGSDIDAQTDIGNLCDVLATADNTTYDAPRMEIDSDTIGTGSGGQLVILDLERRPDNALGAQADVIVKINEHQLVDAFAGI